MKATTDELVWYEVDWQRPFNTEDVIGLLSHIATMTPRGFVAFETRCHEGQIAHLVGIAPLYRGKMIELFKGHGEIELSDVPSAFRKPM